MIGEMIEASLGQQRKPEKEPGRVRFWRTQTLIWKEQQASGLDEHVALVPAS
jgi:hypothetical protein